jgi:hypothetical protein
VIPFVKPRVLPTRRKKAGESMYGFDENDKLVDLILDELVDALKNEDHHLAKEALRALVELITSKESDSATDSLEDAEGV